jgi:shikimate kinase
MNDAGGTAAPDGLSRDELRPVVLVGLMGVGKSTVGRLLAERLGVPLHDTDDLVEARAGRSVREIFAADGEDAFRTLEAEVLADTLARAVTGEPCVVAAAGGVVLAAANRQLLQTPGAVVVWLRAEPSVLAARVGAQDHRPLLDADPAGRLAAMHVERTPLYAAVADLTFDVGTMTPEVIANAIIRSLGGGERGSEVAS